MPGPLPPLAWLQSFEAAARRLNFGLAGEELARTQAAVSLHVRQLEQYLGEPLFYRLPRGLQLTETGNAYHPVVRRALEELAAGTGQLFGAPASGLVKLRVTAAFACYWLAPRLGDFRERHPDVALRLTTSIWPAESLEDPADLEIVYGFGEWQDRRAERLRDHKLFPVCSPDLAENGALLEPADLRAQTLLHLVGAKDDWRSWLDGTGADGLETSGGIQCDTSLMTLQLAMAGTGVALGRSILVEDLIAQGQLIAPFDFKLPTDEAFYLLSPLGSSERREVAAFRAWLLKAAQETSAGGD